MLGLKLQDKDPLTILCLGAHCDDIEIGCGGTLLTLMEKHQNIDLHWHVFTSSPSRKLEAIEGAKQFSRRASKMHLNIQAFRDGYLPYYGFEVKEAMQEIANGVQPDVIFTHFQNDLHQDHRLISELTWNCFRDHLILEYEIPKWDGDMGQPNTFVEISQNIAEQKAELLQQTYNSQQVKKWFTNDLFFALMRLRGMECNASSQLAEAFYNRKFKLDLF